MTKVRDSLFQHPKPQSHHAVTHLDNRICQSPTRFTLGHLLQVASRPRSRVPLCEWYRCRVQMRGYLKNIYSLEFERVSG